MNSQKMQARLIALVDDGLGEWLIRNIDSWYEACKLVDYEESVRRLRKKRRAACSYHRKRLRCIARYHRDGRDRRSGVTMVSSGPVLSFGGTASRAKIEQSCLVSGEPYRVRGLHRSELTGGWVDVMDCDVEDGGYIRSPTIPTTEYTEFDGLKVHLGHKLLPELEDPEPSEEFLRVSDDPDDLDDIHEDWVDADMMDDCEVYDHPVLVDGGFPFKNDPGRR